MLSEFPVTPTIAVSDLQRARDFYEGVLGMPPGTEMPDGVVYAAGSGSFLVYVSQYAGSNRATSMAFAVARDAYDAEIATLRRNGVTFQTYEMDGVTWDDGVAMMGDEKVVWFTDPDGNILAVETAPAAPASA